MAKTVKAANALPRLSERGDRTASDNRPVEIEHHIDASKMNRETKIRDERLVGGKWLRSRMVPVDTQEQSFVRAERTPFSQRRSIAYRDGAVGRALTGSPVTLSCQMRRQADAADRRGRRRRRNGYRRGLGRRLHRRRYGRGLAGSKRQTKRGCQRGEDRSGHGLVRVCVIRFCYRLAAHRAARHTVRRDRQCSMAGCPILRLAIDVVRATFRSRVAIDSAAHAA